MSTRSFVVSRMLLIYSSFPPRWDFLKPGINWRIVVKFAHCCILKSDPVKHYKSSLAQIQSQMYGLSLKFKMTCICGQGHQNASSTKGQVILPCWILSFNCLILCLIVWSCRSLALLLHKTRAFLSCLSDRCFHITACIVLDLHALESTGSHIWNIDVLMMARNVWSQR